MRHSPAREVADAEVVRAQLRGEGGYANAALAEEMERALRDAP